MTEELKYKWLDLGDNFLSIAFTLLSGIEPTDHTREIQDNANEMRCIINGRIKPIQPFANWSKCIAYLQSAVGILK